MGIPEADVSVIMPCRNEEATVGLCIEKAQSFLSRLGLNGEILVVNNASSDRSAQVAAEGGARIISEPRPGYGLALRAGIASARGKVLLMGDCDMTYDFAHMDEIYKPLALGEYDVMIGDRFAGGIEKGAMPLLHKIGVCFLSAAGRARTKSTVRDFHCGLRGLTRQAAQSLSFRMEGMEFATEMIALAAAKGLRIGQAPVPLYRCRYPRRSKLRTLPDGFRHLKYIVLDISAEKERGKHT